MALDDCTAIAEAIGDNLGKRWPGKDHLHGMRGVSDRLGRTPPVHRRRLRSRCLYSRLALTFQSMCILANRHIPLAFRLSSIAYELAGYGGNERFRPLIGILKSYMWSLCLSSPEEPWNISEIETEFLRLKDACEQEMKTTSPALRACSMPSAATIRIRRGRVHQGNPATGSTGSRCSMP